MKITYRVGWPGWKAVHRTLHLPLTLRVDVHLDHDSSRYIAVSPDLDGLVCEAGTLDELSAEVKDCIGMLLEDALHTESPVRARTAMRYDLNGATA